MILTEEIYGNTATVYFRTNEEKLKKVLNGQYKNTAHIDFKEYDQGLYTVFNLKSANDKKLYPAKCGNIIVKAAVKGLSNFFFTDFNLYKKFIDPRANEDTWFSDQIKKFNFSKETSENIMKVYDLWNRVGRYGSIAIDPHYMFSQEFEKTNKLPNQQTKQRLSNKAQGKMSGNNLKIWQKYISKQNNNGKVRGIVYSDEVDGDCILLYDYKSCVPISYSLDDGKTWQKSFEGKEIKQIAKEQNFKFSGNDNVDNFNEDYFPY